MPDGIFYFSALASPSFSEDFSPNITEWLYLPSDYIFKEKKKFNHIDTSGNTFGELEALSKLRSWVLSLQGGEGNALVFTGNKILLPPANSLWCYLLTAMHS